ncbi:MAG: hypothetical protein V3V13_02880 [Paracoccaceae bacterium]
MIGLGQSDLASALGLRTQHAKIRAALDITSKELASGKKTDLVKATGGDLGRLFSIERSLAQFSTEKHAINIAQGKTALMQLSMGQIQDNLSDYGPELLSAVNRGDQNAMRIISADGRNKLDAAVSAMNARYGRHSVFAGAAVDRAALAPADDIFNDIAVIVAAAADAPTAIAAIDAYFFAPGGGFETNIYLGAPADSPPFIDEGGTKTDYSIRADSLEVRQSLRAFAMAAVASQDPGFAGTNDQVLLLREAAISSISTTGDIIKSRETLGFAEGSIADAQARNIAKTSVFELERNAILAADPYESATMFEALQGQLQSVYTITARLSNLNLTNFLR